MNYSEAYEYMESRIRGKGAVQPDQLPDLCARLGKRSEKVKYVHAAGVKGAAAAFVASILRCAGYKVGSFLPILSAEWGERILVGRRKITRSAFTEGVAFVRKVGDQMAAQGLSQLTAECAEAMLALWHFAEAGCQLAVLENAIVVWSPQEVLADGVVWPVNGNEDWLACWDEEPDWGEASHIRNSLGGQTFDYKTYKKLEISLARIGQIENAILAIELAERLRDFGFVISERALYQGLKETGWPGSFEILQKRPYFVVDGADDCASAGELVRTMKLYFENKRVIYIIGMLQGSETERVIRRTVKYADMIITVTPSDPQAIHAFDLAKEISVCQSNVTAADSLEEAVEIGMLLAGKEDVIVAFGTPVLQWRLRHILTKTKKK